MPNSYHIRSTSRQSAIVQDRVLSETSTTRKVLRPEVVNNPSDATASVKITLVYQRKNSSDEWEDTQAIRLSSLHAGDGIKLHLDTQETKKLHEELQNLYAIGDGGVQQGEHHLVVAPEDQVILDDPVRAEAIRKLLALQYPEQVWQDLIDTNPDLVTRLAYARVHTKRSEALLEFEQSLQTEQPEGYWQGFFEKNTWIFGYGLDYRFLRQMHSQPNYGGGDVRGRTGHEGDFLHHTDGNLKFTVLVEIKKPDTPLVSEYRSGIHKPSSELAGGVSQLQVCCRQWELEGAPSQHNREIEASQIYTIVPKGILIAGNLNQLSDTSARNSFELFRRSLSNPEILTFDELLQRARFIVEHGNSQQDDAADETASEETATPEINPEDLPF